MIEYEEQLLKRIENFLADQKDKIKRREEAHFENEEVLVGTLEKIAETLGAVSLEFVQHPLLQQFVNDHIYSESLKLWLQIEAYLATVKMNEAQPIQITHVTQVTQLTQSATQRLAAIEATIQRAFLKEKRNYYSSFQSQSRFQYAEDKLRQLLQLNPTSNAADTNASSSREQIIHAVIDRLQGRAQITANVIKDLLTPHFMREIYTQANEPLRSLFKRYFPKPKTSVFENHALPNELEEDLKQTIQLIQKIKGENDLSSFMATLKRVQRKFRQKQINEIELKRIELCYPQAEKETPATFLSAANKLYRPQCDTALANALQQAAAEIILFTTLQYVTQSATLTSICDEGLLSNTHASHFYRASEALARGVNSENSDAVIFGSQNLYHQSPESVEMIFDSTLLLQADNVYYQSKDRTFIEDLPFKEIQIGELTISFSHTVDERMPHLGMSMMQLRIGSENYFSHVESLLLTSTNVKEVHAILILQFFRYLDRIKESEAQIQIYKALKTLDYATLQTTLIAIGKAMTSTALFNLQGAHEIDFDTLLAVRYKNFYLNIPALIIELQKGNIESLDELTRMLPELAESHRFNEYLLSYVTEAKAVSRLQKLHQRCKVSRLTQALRSVDDKAIKTFATNRNDGDLKERASLAAKQARYAFLIEGHGVKYPEIIAADKLSLVSHSPVFDPVNESTSAIIDNMHDFHAESDPERAFALYVIALNAALSFRESWRNRERIDILYYQKIFPNQAVPEWLLHYTVDKLHELVTRFNFSLNEIQQAASTFSEKLNASNALIPPKIYRILEENPKLTTLVGLWGKFHLSAFDNARSPGVYVTSLYEDDCYHQLQLDYFSPVRRVVSLHLFGGSHGFLDAYQYLERQVKKQGLISQAYSAPVGYIQCDDVINDKHNYFNVTWGRYGEFHSRVLPTVLLTALRIQEPSVILTALGVQDIFTNGLFQAAKMCVERLYGVLKADEWTAIIANPVHTAEDFKKWVARVHEAINKSRQLSLDQIDLLNQNLNVLFASDDSKSLMRDLAILRDIASGFQLYPTREKAVMVEVVLEECLSVEAKAQPVNASTSSTKVESQTVAIVNQQPPRANPIELIQEYAGYMTTSQLRFFAPALERAQNVSLKPELRAGYRCQ